MQAHMRNILPTVMILALGGVASAQETEATTEVAVADAICIAEGESEAKCTCQADALAGVFDEAEMATIGEAAAGADSAAVTAAITKSIGIDQNKNEAYVMAVEGCSGL